jgi:hypothetical protein
VAAGAGHELGGGQPDDGPPTEVGDQQRHRSGVDHRAEFRGHDFDGVDRGGCLDLLE